MMEETLSGGRQWHLTRFAHQDRSRGLILVPECSGWGSSSREQVTGRQVVRLCHGMSFL